MYIEKTQMIEKNIN